MQHFIFARFVQPGLESRLVRYVPSQTIFVYFVWLLFLLLSPALLDILLPVVTSVSPYFTFELCVLHKPSFDCTANIYVSCFTVCCHQKILSLSGVLISFRRFVMFTVFIRRRHYYYCYYFYFLSPLCRVSTITTAFYKWVPGVKRSGRSVNNPLHLAPRLKKE